MKTIGSYLLKVCFLLCFFFPSYSFGVAVPSDIDLNNQVVTNMPSASIDNVVINKSAYKAGEEINGHFVFSNHSNFSLNNLKYRVLIGQNYEELNKNLKLTDQFLDASDLADIGSVDSLGNKTISFKYKIPNHISGKKLAIQINAYTENSIIITQGSSNYITIENNNSSKLLVKNPITRLSNGKEYNLSEGPTIYKDKKPENIYFTADFENKTKNPLEISPIISIYNQQDIGNKTDSSSEKIILKAGESREVSILLPNMDYKPGVYFAEINLLDKTANPLIGKIGVRYIVGGDIATIHAVNVSKKEVKSGESFNLNFSLTGRPMDITEVSDSKDRIIGLDDKKKSEVGSVTIELQNELGEQIVIFSEPFYLYSDTEKNVTLVALNKSKSMKALVSVANEKGFVFLKKEIILDPNFESISKAEKVNKMIAKYVSILIIVLIIAGAIFLFRKRNRNVINIAIFVLIISSPLALKAWVFTGYTFMYATNIYGQTVFGAPDLSIGAPYDYQHFTEGGGYYFWGYAQYLTCANSASRVNMSYSESVTGQAGVFPIRRRPQLGGEATWYENSQFQSPSINVGNKAGLHYLYFTARNANGGLNDTTSGYIPYYVDCASGRSPDANGYCAPTPVPVSGSCGTLNGQSYVSGQTPPTGSASGYCSSGTLANGGLTNITNGSRYSWQCTGSDGGTTSSCQYTTLGDIPVIVPTDGGTSGTGGCPSGTYYCELLGQCISLDKACNTALMEEYFELNPKIKADKIGPVSLKGLSASPSIGNSGYSCVIDWSDKVFKQYDYLTRCTFTTPTTTIEFSPGSTTATTSYRIDNIVKDTLLRMSCTEVDGESSDSEEVACRINWNYKEVN